MTTALTPRPPDTQDAAERLAEALRPLGSVVVAFSGGVDSSLLAYGALQTLGPDDTLAVTADSPSLAGGELEQCEELAASWEMPWRAVRTNEFSNPRYLANDGDRCYWCKDALMDAVQPLAEERGAVVTLGVNIDDLGDHRPGQAAAHERGARFPLVDAGLRKQEVRALAREWDLPTWDRPAMPCLSSRIPYGTPVTVEVLSQIDRAEAALQTMGFRDLRVRHYGAIARIELSQSELVRAAEQSEAIVAALRPIGYRYVTLDLAGLRSGNLNSALGHGGL